MVRLKKYLEVMGIECPSYWFGQFDRYCTITERRKLEGEGRVGAKEIMSSFLSVSYL